MDQMIQSELETEHFLKADGDENQPAPSDTSSFVRWWDGIPSTTKLFCHLVLILLYTCLYFSILLVNSRGPIHPNNALKNLRLRWKPTMSITAGASPFAGGPSDAVDGAWSELMEKISIRVTQDELNQNGNHQNSISLPINGGHLVWLGVFHQLHCLKMLRQLNYRDHYFPNASETEQTDLEVHINHCVENLRQAVMCYPDTSLTTFVWTHTIARPVLDVRRFERKCVDWEYFMSDLDSRVVTFEEVDNLENPFL